MVVHGKPHFGREAEERGGQFVGMEGGHLVVVNRKVKEEVASIREVVRFGNIYKQRRR